MTFGAGVVVGLLIGGPFGLLAGGLCCAAAAADARQDQMLERYREAEGLPSSGSDEVLRAHRPVPGDPTWLN